MPVEPATPLQKARKLMKGLLKQSSDAWNLSVSLGTLKFSEELVTNLASDAESLEGMCPGSKIQTLQKLSASAAGANSGNTKLRQNPIRKSP